MALLPGDHDREFTRSIRSDHRGGVGTGSLFNLLLYASSLYESSCYWTCPSFLLKSSVLFAADSWSVFYLNPTTVLHNYCRSSSVAYFTFDSYSLITVVTATAADLRIVDNNRLPFCRLIIYIKVLELEIKHKHGGFNINYEKATVVWQQFGFGSQS